MFCIQMLIKCYKRNKIVFPTAVEVCGGKMGHFSSHSGCNRVRIGFGDWGERHVSEKEWGKQTFSVVRVEMGCKVWIIHPFYRRQSTGKPGRYFTSLYFRI